MTDPLIVRSVARDDFDQWLPLWEGYNAFYGRTLPCDISMVTWARFFDAYEPVHALAAETGGRLVGLAHYVFHRSTISVAPSCYMQDLFTDESMRGRGVGRALIEEVYARAKAAGSPRVYWQTQEINLTARRLYDKVAQASGFIVYRKEI
jgi:GNAT superfamily N-acetyltransferase